MCLDRIPPALIWPRPYLEVPARPTSAGLLDFHPKSESDNSSPRREARLETDEGEENLAPPAPHRGRVEEKPLTSAVLTGTASGVCHAIADFILHEIIERHFL